MLCIFVCAEMFHSQLLCSSKQAHTHTHTHTHINTHTNTHTNTQIQLLVDLRRLSAAPQSHSLASQIDTHFILPSITNTYIINCWVHLCACVCVCVCMCVCVCVRRSISFDSWQLCVCVWYPLYKRSDCRDHPLSPWHDGATGFLQLQS